jgi:hypothetical protein
VTLFGRYGESQANPRRDHFYSGGLQFAQGLGFYPGDKWGVGYSQLDLQAGQKERLFEGITISASLRNSDLSFHTQYFRELLGGGEKRGYLVPGLRCRRVSDGAGWRNICLN